MANLTVTIDDEVLKRARIRALEQGTSVSAIVADHLRRYAGVPAVQQASVRSLLALANENTRAGGRARGRKRGPRSWAREDLHER